MKPPSNSSQKKVQQTSWDEVLTSWREKTTRDGNNCIITKSPKALDSCELKMFVCYSNQDRWSTCFAWGYQSLIFWW
jgi:hypothetical protein